MKFTQLILRHFWWKITSVLVGTVLWGAIRWDMIEQSREDAGGSGPLVTRVYEDVPIIVMRQATDTNRFLLNPSLVRVKVKGKSSVISEMTTADLEATVSLISLPGEATFRVPLDLAVPEAVTLESVEPREIDVEVVGRSK